MSGSLESGPVTVVIGAAYVAVLLAVLLAVTVRLTFPEAGTGYPLRQLAHGVAAAMSGALALTFAARSHQRNRPVAAVLFGVLFIDLFAFGFGFVPTARPADVFPQTPGLRLLQADSSLFRVLGLGTALPPQTAMVYRLADLRGDGTISLAGQRFDVPSRFRHLPRVTVRFSRWDLSHVHLIDPGADKVLYGERRRVSPNADGSCLSMRPVRLRPREVACAASDVAFNETYPSCDDSTSLADADIVVARSPLARHYGHAEPFFGVGWVRHGSRGPQHG